MNEFRRLGFRGGEEWSGVAPGDQDPMTRMKEANLSLETIIIIVVILALLGFFGRGRIFPRG